MKNKNSTNAIAEICSLERNIQAGSISRKKLEKELARIESKYGEDVFYPCKVIEVSQPWSKESLEGLHDLFQFGCQSKDCLRYMVEVADAVYGARRKKIAAAVVGGAAVASAAAIVGRHFIK